MNSRQFLGLRTVIYKVPDMESAKAWYSKVLDKQPHFDEPYYTGFDVGGYELGLLPRPDKDVIGTQTAVAYWGVENIEAAYRRLLEMGATDREQPENVGGEIMVATVLDPWDNEFGIIYNAGFNAA